MGRPRIACVVGTRPEAIKVAPVVQELRRFSEVETLLISTGQHREMLEQALGAFDLSPDHDLAIMQHGQTLADVTARAVSGLDAWIADAKPDLLIAQGDTTTTFAAFLAAFYRGVRSAHVEAGLRTAIAIDRRSLDGSAARQRLIRAPAAQRRTTFSLNAMCRAFVV